MTAPVYGRPHLVTLPSGIKMLARRPSIVSLISSDGFPDELTTLVWRMGEEKNVVSELMRTKEGIRQLASMMEAYLPFILISPKITSETATEVGPDGVLTGTIASMDLVDEDKNWLFLFGQGLILTPEERQVGPTVAAADLARFREGLKSDVPGQSGAAVQSAAVDASGVGSDQPLGAGL